MNRPITLRTACRIATAILVAVAILLNYIMATPLVKMVNNTKPLNPINMTAYTIHFEENALGLETWYINQDDVITEVIPSALNERFKGRVLESPRPPRSGVFPSTSQPGTSPVSLLAIKIESVVNAQREQPQDLAQ